jgi:peptidoglycan/LPS O-acetylase OafA/YrhL
MSATLTTSPVNTAAPTNRTAVRSIWTATAVAGIAAAIATTLVAAVARAAGVALDVGGEQIPLLGFAQLTLVGALIGGVLATVLHTRVRRPRHTFVVTTTVLTALSLVPDVIVDSGVASKLVLVLTHLVAAAIIVPAQAARTAR